MAQSSILDEAPRAARELPLLGEGVALHAEGDFSPRAAAFDALHPWVVVAYATVALLLTMSAFQPVLVLLALVSALCLEGCLRGWRFALASLRWRVPLIVFVALLNALFSATGSTEIFRLGTRGVYLESLAYGACMGALLVAVMAQFSNASAVLTSDKVAATLGARLPVVSLMVSMSLRLFPRFVRRGKDIDALHWACSAAVSVNKRNRASFYVRLTSVLVEWGMEDSLDTADAMRSRCWASGRKRTVYRRERLLRSDVCAIVVVLVLGALCAAVAYVAVAQFSFYPRLSALALWWGYVPYALFFFMPLAVLGGDGLLWTR